MPPGSRGITRAVATRRGTPARRRVVGMLTTNLVDLYEAQWLGASDAAHALDVDFVCFCGGELATRPGSDVPANAIYDLVSAERLDGLVIWSASLQLRAGASALDDFCARFEPLPIVSVERQLPRYTSVVVGDRQGMRDAVSHLITVHGLERIAFVRGPLSHPGAEERYRGYREALDAHGVAFVAELATPPMEVWDPERASELTTRMLAAEPPVQAIVGANDDLAIAALAAADSAGWRVPEDIAVVGFDDAVNLLRHDLGVEQYGREAGDALVERTVNISASTLPLTTVRVPFHEVGARSVELLVSKLENLPVAAVETVPTELVVRRSCGCLPAAEADMPATDAAPARERLEASFAASVDTTDAPFLALLDELVRAHMREGESVRDWWSVLSTLRQHVLPELDTGQRVRAESLFASAELLVADAADRLAGYRRLIMAKRNQVMREVGDHLSTAVTVDSLADRLALELPRLGIPSCYLATYDAADDRAGARVRLAYEAGLGSRCQRAMPCSERTGSSRRRGQAGTSR
jgi:DNA-binding LacI/PurR family transcriptional regulator